jgi:Zn-dependent protease with chaperone function
MRIVFFVFAVLLHNLSMAHPVTELATAYNVYLDELRQQEVAPGDHPDARKIADTFERVKAAAGVDFPVTLLIAGEKADVFAQSFPGGTVAVSITLARHGDGLLAFMLAHELGHVRTRDISRALAFYAKHVPASVTATDALRYAEELRPQAQAMSHGFEHGADHFAAGIVTKLGYSLQDGARFLASLPDADKDSLTHPAALERARRLKAFR